MSGPLEGLRVVDLSTGPVGGVATQVLADFGADVIKVEPPGGDRFRALPAWPLWLRGKRSIILDLRERGSRRRMHALADGADVLVVSGPPERAARFGADWETACARNPALVHCAITGFGPRGPLARVPAYEGIVAAVGGRMRVFEGQGAREGPVFAALPVASHAASQGAVQGILAALFAREHSGRGQRVETSLLQGLLPYDLVQLLLVQLAARNSEDVPDPTAVGGGMPTLNYHPVCAADGRWIQLGNLLEHLFYAFLEATDLLGEMLAEERFQGPPARWPADVVEAARDRILLRIRERPAEAWMEIFRRNGNVAAEPFLTAQEALDHPDLVAGGDVVVHHHPVLGAVRQIGPLARLGATPGRAGDPAPAPGADTEAVLAEPARRPSLSVAARSGVAPPPGRPLDGVTVLEIATIIAAPLATTLLADLGARVIKVEALGGDPYRHLLPNGVMAVKTNAGKESLCLDLKRPAGREILDAMVRRSDALVHNFRSGVPERLGIDYARARSLRPDLVWVAATGYGPDAPGARRPCTHPVSGAAMGGALLQAGAGMPPEACSDLSQMREVARRLMRANEPNPDPNTSVVIASAVLLGLVARRRVGVGQPIYVNMLAANAVANGDDFLAYAGKPERPSVDAHGYGTGPTYRLYAARDGWVFLAIGSDREWHAFAEALRPVSSLGSDSRFSSARERAAQATALAAAIARAFSACDADALVADLGAVGVACVRADGPAPGAFFAGHPQVEANGFAPRTHHAEFGPMQRWGPLVTCDGGAASYGPGVLAGQHTDALLEELGHAPDEIERLRADRVVA